MFFSSFSKNGDLNTKERFVSSSLSFLNFDFDMGMALGVGEIVWAVGGVFINVGIGGGWSAEEDMVIKNSCQEIEEGRKKEGTKVVSNGSSVDMKNEKNSKQKETK